MTDKPFVPERIYVPTKLNGALKGDKFFETPIIDGVEYIREDVLKEEYAQKMLYVNQQSYDLGRKQAIIDACEWLKEQEEMIGVSFQEDFIERFRKEMREELTEKVCNMKWNDKDDLIVEEILNAIEAVEYEMALNMSDVRQWLKNLKQRLS